MQQPSCGLGCRQTESADVVQNWSAAAVMRSFNPMWVISPSSSADCRMIASRAFCCSSLWCFRTAVLWQHMLTSRLGPIPFMWVTELQLSLLTVWENVLDFLFPEGNFDVSCRWSSSSSNLQSYRFRQNLCFSPIIWKQFATVVPFSKTQKSGFYDNSF